MNTFMMYAQACEGDFTVGKNALDYAARLLADGWIQRRENPNIPSNYYAACNKAGFNYDNLLSEEIDYLSRTVERMISQMK